MFPFYLLISSRLIKNFIFSYLGNIDSDNYIKGCLALMPIQANLIGIIGQTINPNLVTNITL